MRTRPRRQVRPRVGAVLALAALATLGGRAAAEGKACALLTPQELQAALGAPVSGFKSQSLPTGAELCVGQTPAATVLLRLAARSAKPGAEAAGIDAARRMGAQVEVMTDGPITCSTMIPPKSLEQHGFNTTCSVLKDGKVAAVEVTAKSRATMVEVRSLRPLVQRMAGRL